MHLNCAAVAAVVFLTKEVAAGAPHGHYHKKRVLELDTVWDVVYETVTDIIWVTVTDENGIVTTTTTPAIANNVATTPTSNVVASVAATTAVHAPSVAAPVSVAPAPVVSKSTHVASTSVASTSAVVAAPPAVASSVSSPVSVASSVVTPTTLATLIASSAKVAASTTSSTAAVTSSASSSGSKRGLSYNEASYLDLFTGSSIISWCYNWGATEDGTVPSAFEYVPMLWGLEEDDTSTWSANAQSAIDNGATALLAFNEPDNPEQSDITAAQAAAGYVEYMNPFSGKAQLGAPAVTNGGITWLEEFIAACSDCHIDFVPIHWYDSATNFAYFKEYVQEAYVAGGNRTLWITEFGTTSGTTAETVEFLQVVMPWLDEQDYVDRYAYFMDEVGVLLESATELSSIGSTFMDYTSSTISSLIADV